MEQGSGAPQNSHANTIIIVIGLLFLVGVAVVLILLFTKWLPASDPDDDDDCDYKHPELCDNKQLLGMLDDCDEVDQIV